MLISVHFHQESMPEAHVVAALRVLPSASAAEWKCRKKSCNFVLPG